MSVDNRFAGRYEERLTEQTWIQRGDACTFKCRPLASIFPLRYFIAHTFARYIQSTYLRLGILYSQYILMDSFNVRFNSIDRNEAVGNFRIIS